VVVVGVYLKNQKENKNGANTRKGLWEKKKRKEKKQ
jgi:hypothetical protein